MDGPIQAPMNLLQVRRILNDFTTAPQDDPDDIATFTDHALRCVAGAPEEFTTPELLTAALQRAATIMGLWDWQADPPLPQLADYGSWWAEPAWDEVKEAFSAAQELLPPVGGAERQELDRQAARDA